MFRNGRSRRRGVRPTVVVDMLQITDVQVRIVQFQSRQNIYLSEIEGDSDVLAHLELDLKDDRCEILSNGIFLGTMNKRTQYALHSFPSRAALSYSGRISKTRLKQNIAAAAAPSSSILPNLTCKIDVLIYGPRNLGDMLARHLCRCRLFLQHPHPVPASVTYENPQYLQISGVSFRNDTTLAPILVNPLNNSDDDGDVDLPAIIDNLPGHEYLREIDIDAGIDTKLLR